VILLARTGSPPCRLETGSPLALPLFEVAAAHHGPAGVAGKHPSARFHLIIEFRKAGQSANEAEDSDDCSRTAD
jgi:hypothetical protein